MSAEAAQQLGAVPLRSVEWPYESGKRADNRKISYEAFIGIRNMNELMANILKSEQRWSAITSSISCVISMKKSIWRGNNTLTQQPKNMIV